MNSFRFSIQIVSDSVYSFEIDRLYFIMIQGKNVLVFFKVTLLKLKHEAQEVTLLKLKHETQEVTLLKLKHEAQSKIEALLKI